MTQFSRPASSKLAQLLPILPHAERNAVRDIEERLFTWPGKVIYINRTSVGFDQTSDQFLYKARFVLKRPGYSRYSDRVLNLYEDDGDSHYRIRNSAGTYGKSKELILEVNGDSNPLRGTVDDRGFITSFVYGPYAAHSFDSAEELADRRMSEALSLLSLRFDSPLAVRTLQVEHLASRHVRQHQTVPDWQVLVPEIITITTSDLVILCGSFYREGLNSSSVLYAFLCYYKVISVVKHARKTHLRVSSFQRSGYLRRKQTLLIG